MISCAGAGDSLLVVDRDRLTGGDRRLLAHLAADEPVANAELLCELYMRDRRRPRCRRMVAEDTRLAAPTELEGQSQATVRQDADFDLQTGCGGTVAELRDQAGSRYRLAAVKARIAIPELRWCRASAATIEVREPVSVRDVVGALERYEPVRGLSADAIRRHRRDPQLSVSTLSVELERLNASRIVLNRGLREAVLAALEHTELSMSEIALRCGRVKRDRRGLLSGETTWLSRRIGLVCEGGAAAPTPWVHSEVLALVARRGLGMPPREVELT